MLINLGLRLKNTSVASIVVSEKSVFALTPVLLDSCRTNPSLGSFAFAASFGTTTRTVYNLSSNDLGSTVLDMNDTLLFAPNSLTPLVLNSVKISLVVCECRNQFLLILSYWIGDPISPDILSDTRLSTNNFVPLKTVIGTLFCAFVCEDANFISVSDIFIAKYTVFGSIFSG